MNGTVGKDPYSYINALSTEELEALLRAEALSTEDGDPDLTDYILEVIVKRETDRQSGGPPDVKKARQEFDELYRGLEDPLYDSSPMEEGIPETGEEANTRLPLPKTPSRKLRHVLLMAAAVVVAAAVTMVPAFGYPNVIQMVAHLANGTFRFVPDSSASGNPGSLSTAQPDGTYETLPEALEAYGIHEQVFPQILAEDFEQVELDVREYEFTHKIEFYALYKNNSKELTVLFTQRLDLDSSDYEANDGADAQVYTVNKINHQIFENLEQTTIIWRVGPLECSITGNLTLSESKEIIESIYEGL